MVYALDALTGQKKWEFSYGVGMFVESSATLVDGVVYVGSSYTSALFALDSATGKKKWAFTTAGSAWSSPAVANGVAYIGSNNEYTKEGYLWAVDTQTGQAKWHLTITSTLDAAGVQGVVSSPAVANGVVYFGGLDGNLYAVSTAL
jgi:serine/threonine-protein kinase